MLKAAAIFLFCSSSFLLHGGEKKVALLFLTRSDLNHTELWKEWIDPEKYTVYNHPKIPPKDPWFSQFRIEKNLPTDWAWTLLADQALLQAAIEDPDNYKFVFLSEACVPLVPSSFVYDLLIEDPTSWIRHRNIWWDPNSQRVLSEFPKEFHLGNDHWIILNRDHAALIATDIYWIHLSSTHPCAEEAYPSTFLNFLGYMDEHLGECKNISFTYTDWERSLDGNSPYTFKDPTPENLEILIENRWSREGSGRSLFARKFAPEFPDVVLRAILNLPID